MKKFLALTMTLLTVMLAGAAMAEAPFDGVWMQYEDGFEILIPSDWLQLEVTEDMMASNIFDAFCSADGTQTVQIGWVELGAEMTAQDVQALYVEDYPDAEVIELNGVEFVGFTDEASDVAIFAALDGAEPGLYLFYVAPASDEAFADTAVAIVTSIRNIEE